MFCILLANLRKQVKIPYNLLKVNEDFEHKCNAKIRHYIRSRLILLFLVGEVSTLHIIDIVTYGLQNCRAKVGIATQETGRECLCDAEHVVCHEHLTIGRTTRANADSRDMELLGYALTQCGGYLLQHHGEAARLFEQVCIAHELCCLGLILGAHVVCSELMYRLRC